MSKLNALELEELINQWERDSVIEPADAGTELLRIPTLHSKYNKSLTLHNLAAKRAAMEYATLRKLKWMYYSGKLTQEELEKHGWDQFPFALRSDMNVYIDGDQDLASLVAKKVYHEECSTFCVNVMKELNNRTWQLRTYIDYEKFNAGL